MEDAEKAYKLTVKYLDKVTNNIYMWRNMLVTDHSMILFCRNFFGNMQLNITYIDCNDITCKWGVQTSALYMHN